MPVPEGHSEAFISTVRAYDGREYQPYTADDHDFIAEITADSPPIEYKPSPWVRSLILALKEISLINANYRFPWSELIAPLTQDSLAEALKDVVEKIRDQPCGYVQHRDTYCMLSLAMNQLGLQAPAFRDLPPFPVKNGMGWSSEHLLIQRDRIVIDCHWLYCKKSKVYATENAWTSIVNPKLKLQTVKIEKFAATNLKDDYRAESIMELTKFQQAQMAALRGAEMKKAFIDLGAMVSEPSGGRTMARFKKIDRSIREWCCSQPRFEKHYGKYRAYALAREILENSSIPMMAKLSGFIMGAKPLSDSSARQTVAFLERLTSKF